MSGPTSIEQIGNEALVRIGFPESIGNIYEGTRQARALLEVFAQTRDAMLRERDYDFSERIASAAVSPSSPMPPWNFAYQYPSDCLKIRQLYAASYLTNKNDPLPFNWTIAFDNLLSAKVIFSNAQTATLIYTKQVTDITQWDSMFVEALIAALSRRLPPVLDRLDLYKPEVEDEAKTTALAAATMG